MNVIREPANWAPAGVGRPPTKQQWNPLAGRYAGELAPHLLCQSDPYVAEGYRSGTNYPTPASAKRSETVGLSTDYRRASLWRSRWPRRP